MSRLGGTESIPRLPRKSNLRCWKCHACHAKKPSIWSFPTWRRSSDWHGLPLGPRVVSSVERPSFRMAIRCSDGRRSLEQSCTSFDSFWSWRGWPFSVFLYYAGLWNPLWAWPIVRWWFVVCCWSVRAAVWTHPHHSTTAHSCLAEAQQPLAGCDSPSAATSSNSGGKCYCWSPPGLDWFANGFGGLARSHVHGASDLWVPFYWLFSSRPLL